MSNAKHTPGPWRVVLGKEETSIQVWAEIERIADCNKSKAIGFPSKKANARLIAAAPELLAALEWAVRFIDTYAKKNSGPATPEINKCRAAIAKAKGE